MRKFKIGTLGSFTATLFLRVEEIWTCLCWHLPSKSMRALTPATRESIRARR